MNLNAGAALVLNKYEMYAVIHFQFRLLDECTARNSPVHFEYGTSNAIRVQLIRGESARVWTILDMDAADVKVGSHQITNSKPVDCLFIICAASTMRTSSGFLRSITVPQFNLCHSLVVFRLEHVVLILDSKSIHK